MSRCTYILVDAINSNLSHFDGIACSFLSLILSLSLPRFATPALYFEFIYAYETILCLYMYVLWDCSILRLLYFVRNISAVSNGIFGNAALYFFFYCLILLFKINLSRYRDIVPNSDGCIYIRLHHFLFEGLPYNDVVTMNQFTFDFIGVHA